MNRATLLTIAPSVFVLAACEDGGPDPVAVEEAKAKVVSAKAWGRPGPLGIPVEGWAWIVGISSILLICATLLVSWLIYKAREEKRDNAHQVAKWQIDARSRLAHDLATRETCPACGTNSATFVATAASLEAAAARAIEAEVK